MNDRGQYTMEAVLLMVVLLAVTLLASRQMKSQKWASSLVEGPWQPVRGMIEDGVWNNPKDSKAYNPSMKRMHVSPQGETAL